MPTRLKKIIKKCTFSDATVSGDDYMVFITVLKRIPNTIAC